MNSFLPTEFLPLEMNFLQNIYWNYKIELFGTHCGGSKEYKQEEKIETFQDKDGTIYHFKVANLREDNFIRILVLSKDERECVTVFLDKRSGDAIIHNLTYYKDCAVEGLKRQGGGTILLKFIGSYLKSKQQKYKIKRIVLQDNSFLVCEFCSVTTKLARLKMLTDGYTWYGKYGFRPYDPTKQKPDEKLEKAYLLNIKIAEELLTNSLDLNKIVVTINQEEKQHLKLEELSRLAKKYPRMKDFVKRLVEQFDKYCCIINYILEEIYNPMPPKRPLMYDMHKKDFYRNL